MQDLEMKKKVAQEIMDLMDQKQGEKLKKHPKLMAAKIEVEKEEPLEMLAGKQEKPEIEMEMGDESESEMSPEMLQKLLEMVEG